MRARLLSVVAFAATLAACPVDERAQVVFERDVVPIIEASCAASTCHGVPPDAEASGEVINWDLFFVATDSQGRVSDPSAARAAALRAVNTVEAPELSTFVRKPLDRAMGGLAHRGGDNFASLGVEEVQQILTWINLEPVGGEDPEPLTTLEQQFADDVQPTLERLGCMSANCHGPDASIPFRLDGGLRGLKGNGAVRHNYGKARSMLALDGDPAQSRLLRKALPLGPGTLHKGGNAGFLDGLDTPQAAAIQDWACAERLAAVGEPCFDAEEAVASGFVAVRGPIAPQDPFDVDRFLPGSDLWFVPLSGAALTPGTPVNLTAELHDAPADITDPSVSPDGRSVAFAMRTAEDRGHALWMLDLESGLAQQLTGEGGPIPGGVSTDRDPAWGGDGRIWFVSTRAGTVADGAAHLDADLYALDPATGDVVRRSWTPHVERMPNWYSVGANGAEVAFTAVRAAVPGPQRAHSFRFPPGLQTEYHQHFGITPVETLHWDQRELPDGRFLGIVGELGNAWIGGRPTVIDRNFGPELPGEGPWDDIGLPVYAPPMVSLDDDAFASGPTARIWRDPAPLPDGRALFAVAEGALDLESPAVEPTFVIELVALQEDPWGGGPKVASRTVLAAESGISWTDPEPITVRGPLPVHAEQQWDPQASTGLLKHQGLPITDGIMANLAPWGPKYATDGIVGVRVVEAIAVDPVAAAAATQSGFGPSRILAEMPLEADGSFFLELPAGIAFRLQPLDARGMTHGVMHNRWFDIAPGQTISQGVPSSRPELYDARCAGCHGSLSGDPSEAFPVADVLTTATLTLSRFEAGDPRRPKAAVLLGDATRQTVTFVDDVQPLIETRCLFCHSGSTPTGGLDLGAGAGDWHGGYLALLGGGGNSAGGGQYLDRAEGKARGSWLIERLLAEELDAPGPAPEEAHPAGGALTADEVHTIVQWIETGALYAEPTP